MTLARKETASRSMYHSEYVKDIFTKLDEAICDMEEGRVQSIEDAWEEIDTV